MIVYATIVRFCWIAFVTLAILPFYTIIVGMIVLLGAILAAYERRLDELTDVIKTAVGLIYHIYCFNPMEECQ